MNNYHLIICAVALITPCRTNARTMELQGVTYDIDTIQHYCAGPAMTYSRLAVRSENNSFGASVLEIDMTNSGRPGIKVEAGCDSVKTSEAVTAVARRKSNYSRRYVAAINGDFFITSSFAANHPLGTQILGYPNVTSATCGKIISPDAIDRKSREKCFIMTTDGKMYIDATDLSYSIELSDNKGCIEADNMNYPRADNEVIVYNSFYGSASRTDNTGYEVALELAEGETWGFNRPIRFKVVDTATNTGNIMIPANGAVISAGKDTVKRTRILRECKSGDEILININLSLPAHDGLMPENISEIIGGDVRVLNKGKTTIAGDPDALRFINAPEVRYQRSLIGFNRDFSSLVLCCVDNGIGGGGVSYYDAGDLMRGLGCYDALDLDGGGSTLMYLHTPGIVSHLRDGAERAVGNGIYAIVEAPEDNIVSSICFAEYAPRIIKNSIYKPVFYGYNKNGELISMDVEGVKLDVPVALGNIQPDGSLLVTGCGSHLLSASYNGSKTTAVITVVADTDGHSANSL